jgi:acetylornithine/N-succinyldiaminopimelate aminotransferase
MVAATGQKKFQEPYTPLPGGFVNVAYDRIEAIQEATTSQTCAVMLEPIQAEGGVNIPSDDYLREVRDWCDQKGILLILDEIQTGMGRIGTLFGYQQWGVEPDIATLAKGLASGVPIGVVMAKSKADVFQVGEHGSTFGGNPLACAAACATLKFIIDNDIPGSVDRVGRYLSARREALRSRFDFVVDVRGRGLLKALEFDRDIADSVLMACLDRGLLVNKVKPNTLRFIPPLIIGEKEVDQAMGILEEVLAEVG